MEEGERSGAGASDEGRGEEGRGRLTLTPPVFMVNFPAVSQIPQVRIVGDQFIRGNGSRKIPVTGKCILSACSKNCATVRRKEDGLRLSQE